MRTRIIALLALAALGGCTWETYQNQAGQTRLRHKYPAGTGIYYTEGAASQNTHYHSARPVQHVILPEKEVGEDEEGQK